MNTVKKYFKPTSVTWWSGVLLVAQGVLGAAQTHDWQGLASDPHVLQGIGLIGLRGAIGETK